MLDQLIIDSFAGGGGASTGIEMAVGRSPDIAINHSTKALAMHAVNHPETLHLDSNIWDVDPIEVTKGRPVGLLWASPDCKHFSKAKGGAPLDRNIRDLAWVIVDWAEKVRPVVIIMENVEEFLTWGPIGNEGQPIKEFAGQTFNDWIQRLRKAGYKVQYRVLRAKVYGAPTIRERFYLIARRDGRPIVWPKPTHFDVPLPKSPMLGWPVVNGAIQIPESPGTKKRFKTAAECIDWRISCPSIFDSSEQIKDQLGLRAQRPLAVNTMARIARGMKRYVLDADEPFLVNLTHGGRCEPVSEPFRTITGAHRGEKAVVAPHVMTMRNSQKPFNGADEPTHTITAGGAGLSLVAASITKFNGGATGQDMREPMATITANSYIKRPGGAAPLGLLAPNLLSLKGTARRDSPVSAAHPTVLAGGNHSALISPILTYAQHGGANRAMAEPSHTITASRKDQNALISPTLLQIGYGERAGQAPRALDPLQPLGTVVASGIKHAVAAPWFAKYYGTAVGSPTNEPLHTVTVKDRMAHLQAQLEAPPFTPEHEARAREVAEFLRAHDAWDGGEFVTLTIHGETFVVVDIGMRMLTPRELFNAQGFPPDHVIEGAWIETNGDWEWRAFTKDIQVSCCGNSVCPDVARALVQANCEHLIAKSEAA